jgi:hypothetical protein
MTEVQGFWVNPRAEIMTEKQAFWINPRATVMTEKQAFWINPRATVMTEKQAMTAPTGTRVPFLVQTGTGLVTVAASSITMNFSRATTTGNFLWLGLMANVSSLTLATPSGWTFNLPITNSGWTFGVWSRVNAPSISSVTVTYPSGTAIARGVVLEFGGFSHSGALDKTIGMNNFGTANPTTSATGTISTIPEFAVGAMAGRISSAGFNTPTNGFAEVIDFEDANAASIIAMIKQLPSFGSPSTGCNASISATNYLGILSTYTF